MATIRSAEMLENGVYQKSILLIGIVLRDHRTSAKVGDDNVQRASGAYTHEK